MPFAKCRTLRLGFNMLVVGFRPVIQILCHVLARGWRRWLRYFTEAKAEVKYRASARIRGPKHDTRFEWPVSILIMTRHPFHPIETHKTSAKNPRLLTIAGAISFCRYRQCKPSQLWMHAPVAKEIRLMTSQYPIFDHTDNLNPQWMQAVNGWLCELLGRLSCILINYIMINNENSSNLSADSLLAPQIQIVWGFLSGPRDRQ